MTDSKHKAWLFDLDGTLYSPTPVKLFMAGELLLGGLGQLGSIRAFREEHEALRSSAEVWSPSPYQEQISRTATKLNRDPDELASTIKKWMQDRPRKWIRLFARKNIIRELRAYRQAGGKTALVSDYPASGKLKALGIESDFDAVISNGEPGGPQRLKPYPDGYLAAAETLGFQPQECLVIGDREDADGLAAKSAGMDFRLV